MKEKSQAFTISANGALTTAPIRKSAMEKKDSRILAIASREIVAGKACYHRTCYKGYTRTGASHNGASDNCGESLEDEYAHF